jgi:hypothetical protein
MGVVMPTTRARARHITFATTTLILAVAPNGCAHGGNADSTASHDASIATANDAAALTDPPQGPNTGLDSSNATDSPSDPSSDASLADAAADGGCTTGKILCGTTCVDPKLDPTNCGACNAICASGVCGTTLTADMSGSPPNWTFNGSAAWDPAGPSARLTASMTQTVAGTAIYNHAIVTDAFDLSFQFRIGANGGGRYDGMGFILQVNGPSAVGSGAGGLGMSGLAGYGVEFDVYNNGQCGDSNANHVGIDKLTTCGNGLLTSLFASPDLTGTVDLADANWHTATVHLVGDQISVTVDAHAVATNVTLTGFTTGTSYYYGFAGAIGGGSGSLGMQTEVKAVSLTFPSPRCL